MRKHLNKRPIQLENTNAYIYVAHSSLPTEINSRLMQGFLNYENDSSIKRSHFFEGRYENIYLDENHIPELKPLIEEAVILATNLLNKQNLQAGYWFNHMPPGAVTLPHRHDDDDELLSAVYYISVADNAGELIIQTEAGPVKVQPQNSMFVFFRPDAIHEVSENQSTQHRLSLGINFGIPRTDD